MENVESTKLIPFSSEAEGYVLGSIMLEPNLAEEYCGRLTVDDFYLDVNKKVFAAIYKLYKARKMVDVASVIEQLKSDKQYEAVGGNKYLFELVDSVPSSVSSSVYIDILLEKSIRRELYYRSTDIAKKVIDNKLELSDLLAQSEKQITELVNSQDVSPVMKVGIATEKVMEWIEKNRELGDGQLIGLDTGFDELNKFTFGFQPGQLIILAARPGVGKSAFSMNICQRMAKRANAHVLFFSLEMSTEEIILRMLSSMSNVKMEKIKTGKMSNVEMARLLQAKSELDDLNIYLDVTKTNTLEDMKVKCRKLKRENNLDFVIIDYLQLMSLANSSRMSRYDIVTAMTRSLKLLAGELGVPVLALSQLSREVEKRSTEDKPSRPMLSDLRESGSIEQDADIVIFLHTEGSNGGDAARKVTSAKTEVIIDKNRQGERGYFNLVFRGDCQSYESMKKDA